MQFKHLFFCLAVISIFVAVSFSQSWHDADEGLTNELRKNGVKYETKRAIVWAEKGSLTEQEIKDFAALANQGIIDIEKHTGTKFDKKHYQAEKIEYFISRNAGISRGSIKGKPFIYMRSNLVKNKKAPYLHETTHIIVWKSLKSLWLQEGFANHVQTFVSQHYGGYASSPFNSENTEIDQLARNLLKSESGKKVLPLIGLNGTPLTMNEEQSKIYAPIFEDRKDTAPAFYNLSESFVKFLVEKIGIKKMRKVFEAQDTRDGIEKVTGKNVDEWKGDWLKSLVG
jgi:hypothetical protein